MMHVRKHGTSSAPAARVRSPRELATSGKGWKRDPPSHKVAAPSAFARYYDAFLQNSFAGARWRITALSGEKLVGVPMAGSLVDPRDPNVSFIFRSEDRATYQIHFSELAEAEPLGK